LFTRSGKVEDLNQKSVIKVIKMDNAVQVGLKILN